MIGSNLSIPKVTSPFVKAFDSILKGKSQLYLEKVNERLYRGSGVTDKDFPLISKLGIEKVINIQTISNLDNSRLTKAALKNNVEYANRPLNPFDMYGSMPAILKELDDPAVKLVYCLFGRHRTGVVTAMERYLHNGVPMKESIQEMHEHGFGLIHQIFFRSMENYLKKYARMHPQR